MPRLNRRIRKRGGVTSDQRAYLAFGIDFFGNPKLFENDAEERKCWEKCRAEMLPEETRPGHRPYGYYRFDLGIANPPRDWWQELSVLEGKNLLTPGEFQEIEGLHRELSPDSDLHFMASFLDPAKVRKMNLDIYSLKRQVESMLFSADWHARRGRREHAEHYAGIAEVVRGVMEGTK